MAPVLQQSGVVRQDETTPKEGYLKNESELLLVQKPLWKDGELWSVGRDVDKVIVILV